MPTFSRIAVGVDLSLTATLIAGPGGTLRKVGKKGVTVMPLKERGMVLFELAGEIREILCDHRPGTYMPTNSRGPAALVVLENLPMGGVAGGVSTEKAYLWWELVRQLIMCSVPVVTPTPSQVKVYACGAGNASKREVITGVQIHLPMFAVGNDDNKADAATMCAMGMELLGTPLAVLPDRHRRALAKLQLPAGVL